MGINRLIDNGYVKRDSDTSNLLHYVPDPSDGDETSVNTSVRLREKSEITLILLHSFAYR